MDKIKIVKSCVIITGAVGVLVMAGWIFDIGLLKSILPGWVTMKFPTAISFLSSAVILYFITKIQEKDAGAAVVAIPIAVLVMLIFMALLLLSNITGLKVGIEDLFIKEKTGAVMTTSLGRPCVVTMINFILIAAAGVLSMFKNKNLNNGMFLIGCVLIFTGGLAGVGYSLNFPLFTGYGPQEEMKLLFEAVKEGMLDEILRKPIWPEELIKAVEKHTGGKGNEQ